MRPVSTILLLPLVLLAGVASAQGIYPGDAVLVNGEKISYQRFYGFYNEYRNSQGIAVGARGDQLEKLTRIRQEAMDLLIEQTLVAQAAAQAGIIVPDAVVEEQYQELRSKFDSELSLELRLKDEGFTEASMRDHIRRTLAGARYVDDIRADVSELGDKELEQFYRDNEARLTYPEQVRVRHILLAWKPLGTTDDRAALRRQIEAILAKARAGEDFAALAAEYSDDDGTKAAGGDTGRFQRGEMVTEFEAAAFALEIGEISDPVQTSYGWHIILKEEHLQPYLLPFDEVRDKLREYVVGIRQEQAVDREIDRLKAAAEIEVLIPLATRQ